MSSFQLSHGKWRLRATCLTFLTRWINDPRQVPSFYTHRTALPYWLRHCLFDLITNSVSLLLVGPLVQVICYRLIGCVLTWELEA